jgi:hypothetical protein
MTTVINNQLKGLKGNVRSAVESILLTGFARTGSSGYSGGWSSKSVWTADTVAACQERGIIVESGNDAPRGGASGEYVRLVADKRKNRSIHTAITARVEAARLEKEEKEARELAAQSLISSEADRLIELARELGVFVEVGSISKAERHELRQAGYRAMSAAMKQRGIADVSADFFKVMNRIANTINQ